MAAAKLQTTLSLPAIITHNATQPISPAPTQQQQIIQYSTPSTLTSKLTQDHLRMIEAQLQSSCTIQMALLILIKQKYS